MEYNTIQKGIKHMWVNKSDLFTNMNPEMTGTDLTDTSKEMTNFYLEFNRNEYNRLLCKIEQKTAENWCNTRKMIRSLLQDVCEKGNAFSGS